MTIKRTVFIVALLLLAAALVPAASARSPLWRAPETVTPTGPSYAPRVAYDRDGFVHVAFFAGPIDSEWEVFYTNNRGGAWSIPRLISDGGLGSQRNPDIAVGRDGRVHIVYEKRIAAAVSDVYYAESPDLGATWAAPSNLSRTPPRARAYEPAIAVDANNTLHVVWIDSRWNDLLQATYAARPAAGAFSAPLRIGGNTFEVSPDLTTSGSGANVQLHIVYSGRRSDSESTSDYEIYYVSAVGATFSRPRNLTNDPGDWSLTPSIVSNGAGELYLAWDTEGSYHDIAFARSTNAGASWTAPVNLTPRGSPSLNPALAYGLLDGAPVVQLIWSEGAPGQPTILTTAYLPASNSFGPLEEAGETGVFETAVAASPVTNQVVVVYRNRSSRVVATFKGVSNSVGATIRLQGDAAVTRDPVLQVALSDFSGEPIEMRYILDRPLDARDPWVPLRGEFSLTAPPSSLCRRTLYVQLRNAVGRVSPVLSREIVVDTTVQAQVELRGVPSAYGGHPDYAQDERLTAQVRGAGECVGLRYLFLGGPAPFLIDDDYFAAELPLPPGDDEGPRRVALRLQDNLGNQQFYSKTLIVDHTPPELLTGTLRVDAPPEGLPTTRGTLLLAGVEARDNLYPGGYYAALVANASGPQVADDDPALVWRPVSLTVQDGRLLVVGWNLLRGLSPQPADNAASRTLDVRLKLLDGAGNPSPQTLSAPVTLAAGYRSPEAFLPLVTK